MRILSSFPRGVPAIGFAATFKVGRSFFALLVNRYTTATLDIISSLIEGGEELSISSAEVDF